MKKIEIIDKRCLHITHTQPIFKHDLPFEPDLSHAIHDLEVELIVQIGQPGPHEFIVNHHWSLFNPQEFELMQFSCKTRFGFFMSRKFLKRSEIPLELLVEYVHAGISHSRVLLSMFCAERQLMDKIAIDFVETNKFLPTIRQKVSELPTF